MNSSGLKVEAIVFDFDGTIGDTRGLIVSCFLATYDALGIDPPTEADIASTIGLPLERSFEMLSGLSEAESGHAAEVYRRLFTDRGTDELRPIPGMPEVVAACSTLGVPLAVGSSRGHASLDPMLELLGVYHYFDAVLDHDDAGKAKPAPDMLFRIAERFGVAPEGIVMIGDTVFDLEMGRNAGARTIGVTWGNHGREQLLGAEPTLLVDRPSEILDYLEG